MNDCPCCSQTMLRHTRHGQIYWFCTHCHQEMPNLSTAIATIEHRRAQTNFHQDSTTELFKLL